MRVEQHKALQNLTTLQVGGSAEYFVVVTSESELKEAVSYAQQQSLPFTILGEGSNVLISDEGIKGLVIHMAIKGITHTCTADTVSVTAAAGELLDDVVLYAVEKDFWGIENLSHIPGTIGAAPVQNIGAYGVEVSDVISTVSVFNTHTGGFENLKNENALFGYRSSLFKTEEGKKYIITSVTFTLSKNKKPRLTYKDLQEYFDEVIPSLEEIRKAVIEIRAKKFPNWRVVGTAGSFFKNPTVTQEKFNELRVKHLGLPGYTTHEEKIKISLGWILDKVLHLKGYRNGNVALYTQQALVLVTEKTASADDIERFANEIVEKIKNEIDVVVEWEVTKLK